MASADTTATIFIGLFVGVLFIFKQNVADQQPSDSEVWLHPLVRSYSSQKHHLIKTRYIFSHRIAIDAIAASKSAERHATRPMRVCLPKIPR